MGRTIAGRYVLERELGRGGMGAVHLAHDTLLGRAVALKRVAGQGTANLPGSPDEERARREARLAASLNHPHVVAVFDLAEDGEDQWLVMEHVAGSSLAALLATAGPLDRATAAGLLGQVARALAAAHAAGIVHRDVKPSNILITEDGVAKLGDFGIARAASDPSLTATGIVTGSPAYLAPEVASGSSATAASDLWSLGATLFHALSGKPPYDFGDNVVGGLYRIVHEEPPRLALDGPLAEVLGATMVRDPAARWEAARVRDALLGAAAVEPGAQHVPVAIAPPATPDVDASPSGTRRLTPAAAPLPPAATAATGTAAGHGRRASQRLPAAVAALVALLLVGVLAVVLVQSLGGDDGATPARGEGTTSGTANPASSAPPADEVSVEALQGFAETYVATAAEDPEAGFAMLTPEYQKASGGLAGYTGFWGKVTQARILDFPGADPAGPTVSYTYRYRLERGGPTTQTVTLQLVRSGDSFLISGAS